jgi:hypothetical protein
VNKIVNVLKSVVICEVIMPKHKAYSVQEKLDMVGQVRNGKSQAKVSREYGVPEGTLRGWLKETQTVEPIIIYAHEAHESTPHGKSTAASIISSDESDLVFC